MHPPAAAVDLGMTTRPLDLSVLDLSPVCEGSSAADALRSSVELAAHAERLGYRRYWVAEHHNMPGIASSSPAVLLALAAATTSRIHLGSGGVMLPNHSPLAIAEQFGMLEALHPGRIDLGIGRAPGSDQVTARALRRTVPGAAEPDLADLLTELIGYFTGRFPEGHRYAHIVATAALGNLPALWILGSSDYGAMLAGHLGLPFAFAHHFAGRNTEAAVQIYRQSFRPSATMEQPRVMLGVGVVCADTDDEATYLAGSTKLSFVRLRSGRPGRLPHPDEAVAHQFTPMERELLREWSPTVGSPTTVRAALDDLVARTGADELSITTNVHDHAARFHSFELLAEVGGLGAVPASASAAAG
jgi:luciferase family oxidoreductase group 1